jgi:hypothetical protein
MSCGEPRACCNNKAHYHTTFSLPILPWHNAPDVNVNVNFVCVCVSNYTLMGAHCSYQDSVSHSHTVMLYWPSIAFCPGKDPSHVHMYKSSKQLNVFKCALAQEPTPKQLNHSQHKIVARRLHAVEDTTTAQSKLTSGAMHVRLPGCSVSIQRKFCPVTLAPYTSSSLSGQVLIPLCF